ncbi:MAG: hypothetical protein ACXABY_00430 [Candidatus Thorarchaeota archaeon]|jgi:hypothetical protein
MMYANSGSGGREEREPIVLKAESAVLPLVVPEAKSKPKGIRLLAVAAGTGVEARI